MKKVPTLKSNKNNYNLRRIVQNIYMGSHEKTLPPSSSKYTSEELSEKRLLHLIGKIEHYISDFPGTVSNILKSCLHLLTDHLPAVKRLNQSVSIESMKVEDNIKILNDSVESLRKENRNTANPHILKKVTTLKLQDRRHFRQRVQNYDRKIQNQEKGKQLMYKLNTKMTEKQEILDCLKAELQETKVKKNQMSKQKLTLQQNIHLMQTQNEILSNDNARMIQKVLMLQNRISELQKLIEENKVEWKKKYSDVKSLVKQRQEQVQSVWQAFISNENICFL